MVTFRNNNNSGPRRNNFRRNDRNYKPSGDRPKFNSNFSNNENFKRKAPGRNNHNASKLIEKYNDLAREASSSGDKILSENYLQHADHFTRILNEQESQRKTRFNENKSSENNLVTDQADKKEQLIETSENTTSNNSSVEKTEELSDVKKIIKSQPEVS